MSDKASTHVHDHRCEGLPDIQAMVPNNQVIKTAVEKAGILNKRLIQLFDGDPRLNHAEYADHNECHFCYQAGDHLLSCPWLQAKLAFEDMQKYSGLFEG